MNDANRKLFSKYHFDARDKTSIFLSIVVSRYRTKDDINK